MASKNFVKDVRLKVEFLKLSQTAFAKMKLFKKMYITGEFNFIKKANKPQNCSSFDDVFFHNLHACSARDVAVVSP